MKRANKTQYTRRNPTYTLRYYIDKITSIPDTQFPEWDIHNLKYKRVHDLLPQKYFDKLELKEFMYVMNSHHISPNIAKAAYIGGMGIKKYGFHDYESYGDSPKERLLNVMKEHLKNYPNPNKIKIKVDGGDLKILHEVGKPLSDFDLTKPKTPQIPTKHKKKKNKEQLASLYINGLPKGYSFKFNHRTRCEINALVRILNIDTQVQAIQFAIANTLQNLQKIYPHLTLSKINEIIEEESEKINKKVLC